MNHPYGSEAKPQSAFWADKRVFVTGASGFLGSWTVQELNCRGAITIGYVRDGGHHLSRRDDPETEPHFVVHGQLENYETVLRAINEHEADSVLHLGAQPIVGVANRSPRSTFEANIRGTWNVLDACRELGRQVKRIVVASSGQAYGVAAKLPYDETMPLNGNHPYDASKACTEILAQTYFHSYGLPVCVTRAGNFFGGRDLNFNRIVPGVARWAIRGEQPVMRSDGSMIRDYIYVRDVVLGYLTLAERMEDGALHGHAFNLSTEQPISVIALVRRILAAAGREDLEPIIRGGATNEIPEQHLSTSKAKSLLGWAPLWTLDKALDETLAWYRDWLEVAARRLPHDDARPVI